MAKNSLQVAASSPMSHGQYEHDLLCLQIELVKLQRHVIGHGLRILVILEGRDTAGKDGPIKRIVVRDLLSRLDYPDRHKQLRRADRAIVFPYEIICYERGLIAAEQTSHL